MIVEGERFTQTFVVSPEVHRGFIATFGDRHPLHTDKSYAIAHGYKAEVMHGNILNGFISYFIGECIPDRNLMILAQEIKFSKPVYLGDQITLNAQVTEVHESVGLVEFGIRFVNQENVTVAIAKLQGRALSKRS